MAPATRINRPTAAEAMIRYRVGIRLMIFPGELTFPSMTNTRFVYE